MLEKSDSGSVVECFHASCLWSPTSGLFFPTLDGAKMAVVRGVMQKVQRIRISFQPKLLLSGQIKHIGSGIGSYNSHF